MFRLFEYLVTLSRCFHFTLPVFSFQSTIPRYFSVSLVGPSGLEPPTSRLSGVRSNHLSYEPVLWSFWFVPKNPFFASRRGGDKRDRTADPLLAKQVLSQLSYTPVSSAESLRAFKIKQRLLRIFRSDLGLRNLIPYLSFSIERR